MREDSQFSTVFFHLKEDLLPSFNERNLVASLEDF